MGQNQMKKRRLKLDSLLQTFCKNVYYQPPSGLKMTYPCIRYRRTDIEPTYADDLPYLTNYVYEIVVIDRDPDSVIVDKVSQMPYTAHTGHYTADNLNHDRFITYA